MRSKVLGSIRAVLMVTALPGCIAVVDFDYGGAGQGGSEGLGGAGAGGTPIQSGGGGAGGAGGAPCDANLESDRENCGTCGFSCGESDCDGGRCAATLSFAATIRSVLVDGDHVYVATLGSGALQVVPLDFTSTSSPVFLVTPANANGELAKGTVGEKHVYFSGQLNNKLYACDPDDCVENDIVGVTSQINGVALRGDKLYLAAASPQNLVGSLDIDPTTGVPAPGLAPLVTTCEGISTPGLREIHIQSGSPERLLFSGFGTGGCLYAIDVGDAPGNVACASATFDMGRFVVSPGGIVIADDTATGLVTLSGDGLEASPLSDAMKGPLAADDTWVYGESRTVAGRLVAKRLDGTGDPIDLPLGPGAISSIDASDPRYVVYAAGSTLLREPKPSR